MGIPSKRAAVATLIAVLAPTLASAQRRGLDIEVSPVVGGFIPTQDLGEIRLPGTTSGLITTQAQMTTEVAFGGRVTLTGRGRFGLEGSYLASNAKLRTTTGIPRSFDARVQAGSAKLIYRATSEQSGTDLVLGGGIAGVDHSGPGFQYSTGQFDVGGVAAAGLRIEMTSMVSLRFDGELYLYPWTAGPGFAGLTQTDLFVTIGLGLKLGH